jgi:hypothetical protein
MGRDRRGSPPATTSNRGSRPGSSVTGSFSIVSASEIWKESMPASSGGNGSPLTPSRFPGEGVRASYQQGSADERACRVTKAGVVQGRMGGSALRTLTSSSCSDHYYFNTYRPDALYTPLRQQFLAQRRVDGDGCWLSSSASTGWGGCGESFASSARFKIEAAPFERRRVWPPLMAS